MPPFVKDPNHWIFRLSPEEWVRAAQRELGAAERAFGAHNARAGHAGARRAAGMALNGALIVEPDAAWGRTYVEHVAALARGAGEAGRVPASVREAARFLVEAPAPGGGLVALRSRAADERLLEAARTVMAHAYARVRRAGPWAPAGDAPSAGGGEAATTPDDETGGGEAATAPNDETGTDEVAAARGGGAGERGVAIRNDGEVAAAPEGGAEASGPSPAAPGSNAGGER
jgi:hypothetical protein